MWVSGAVPMILDRGAQRVAANFRPVSLRISRCLPSLKRSLRLSLKGAAETPVCFVPESEMVPSSPASSPAVCI
jgi:hypothetical protein